MRPERRSLYWCSGFVLAAFLWACLAVAFVVWYPLHTGVITEQGVPVKASLYSQDHLWLANFAVIGFSVLCGAVDLAVRVRRRFDRPGPLALTVGVTLALYSLFGLLYGVLGIAPIGLLLALSARSIKFAPSAVWSPPRWQDRV
jgi:hypothetical protein